MAPQSSALTVLITRPHAQALRFATQLTTAFGNTVAPVICPLLAPIFLRPDISGGPFGALILSSETGAHAAAALRKNGSDIPDMALCVGDQTADVARSLGFDAQSAGGNVADLLALVQHHRRCAPFLHLRGRDTTGDLIADLAAAGIAAQARVVYAQQEQPLSGAGLTALLQDATVCVPLFSPRSARLFTMAVSGIALKAPLIIVAISEAAAHEIAPLMASRVVVAAHPDGPSMVRAVGAVRFKP